MLLLHLSDQSNEPLQGQIVRQIRSRILAGRLAAGAALPSIRALAREQKVSVITVQRAYETLERLNLIHSRRGKGFFISDISDGMRKTLAFERLSDRISPPITDALEEGLTEEEVRSVVSSVLNSSTNEHKGQ